MSDSGWRRCGRNSGRPAFPFIKTPVELDLVVLSVFELGFGDRASLHDIYDRAVAQGFELCPAEVGPALRLNYLDQPLGEFLHIAMRPVARYTGELIDFSVGNAGAGLILISSDGVRRRRVMLSGAERFVFIRPRADTIVSGAPRVSGDSFGKTLGHITVRWSYPAKTESTCGQIGRAADAAEF